MNWAIWAPVLAGLGTLIEVRHEWTIDDLLDAHEALDVRYKMEKQAADQAGGKS